MATGARDFSPPPPAVKVAVGKAYRARRTLVLGFKDDGIDESDEIEEILKEEDRDILWTPPYCPELQPIKFFWAVRKNHVAL